MPKIPFNVDAYTAKLIGRENVSKLDGAILELVKNAYDADASVCLLYYEQNTNTLYIGDNGTGMTESVIMKHWMTIGSSSKTVDYKTRKGRVQTGAKGIGRFALDRIADNCNLLTISQTEHLLWSVDWNSFEFGKNITETTASLDSVSMSFDEFTAEVANTEVLKLIFEKFTSTGTIFKLTDLRDDWNKSTVDSIKQNLKTLIPPEFKEVFNIYFFEQDTTEVDAAVLQESDDYPFDYKIKFLVNTNGTAKIALYRDEFDFKDDFNRILVDAGFAKEDRDYFSGKPIEIITNFAELCRDNSKNTIGDFNGTLYFSKLLAPKLEKEKYYYKDISGRPDIRDTFGGIRIYRDGFRVRPYGEPKTSSSDWLLLSARKNKSPAAISHESGAWRVNSDQMHGSIYISRTNVALPDQSNRQGIVETKEFKLLREVIENIIKLFERDRQYVCRTLNRYYDKMHPTAAFEAELSQKIAEDSKKQKDVENSKISSFSPSVMDVAKVSEILDKKESTIQELENEIKMLRVLATTGIVTNTYVHEIKDLTHKLSMKIVMAKESLEIDNDINSAITYINAANDIRESFNSWFKVTIESVRKDKRTMQCVDVHSLLGKLTSAWTETLKPKNIDIFLAAEDVNFQCFPYELESIVNNLIANSVASFDRVRVADQSIYISVIQNDMGIVIKYRDTGIGLTSAYKKSPRLILEPFETDKATSNGDVIGTGMGMWIISRTASEYNGSIDLSENLSKENGFHVQIYLNGKYQ